MLYAKHMSSPISSLSAEALTSLIRQRREESGIAIDHTILEKYINQNTTQVLSVQADIAQVHMESVLKHQNEHIILLDIGADKALVTHGMVDNEGVRQLGKSYIQHYTDGQILPFIVDNMPKLFGEGKIKTVSVSSHGKIVNHKYLADIVPQLDKELSTENFTNDMCGFLNSKVTVEKYPSMFNDAVCGGAFSFGRIKNIYPDKKHIIYLIIGGGTGGCYIDENGLISASEPGHITWIPYADDPQSQPCLQEGPKFCAETHTRGLYLETVLAKKYLGTGMPGRDMNDMLSADNPSVWRVYLHGARNAASVVSGLFFGFWLLNEKRLSETIVVTQGGVADNVKPYNSMIQLYLMEYLHTKFPNLKPIPVIATSDLLQGTGDNAGAIGAGLLAFS